TIATTIDQQVALDEALIPSTKRLRIGRSNFRLPSDIQSKESTLQVVYDILRNSPFFRAFQVTADVPEIYMQEFWATAKLHHNSIHFKMDTKKSVLDLEEFREMLHISPRIPNQSFAELPFEEEILEFLRSLGHSDEIRYLTDVNVNKLYQPWRSFASVINKCLTGKSSGIDSFRLSQAQILWGFHHKINVDYAYLIWEDFVYQPSISRRNKINWHYVRDDVLFSTIKVVSRHQTTQQYGAILPIELTTDDIRNSKVYKEYYACATGEAAAKPKASARKKKGDSASSTTPPTLTPTTTVVAAPRLSATAKGKQPARAITPTEPTDVERIEAEQLKIVLKRSRQETHISQQRGSDTDEGIGSRPGVLDVPSDDLKEELSWNSFDDEEGDEQTKGREESEGDKTDESDDGSDDRNDDDDDETVKVGSESDKDDDDNDDEEETAKNDDEDTESGKGGNVVSKRSEDESNDEEDQELRLSEEARIQEEEEADELYHNVNINQGRGLQVTQNIEDSHVTLTPVHLDGLQESSSVSSFVTSMLNPISDAGVESIFTTASSPIVSLQTPTPIMTPSTIATITTSTDASIPPTTIPSIILENLPTFNSAFRFDERLKSLENTFSEYRQTNLFVDAVSAIPENDEFLRNIDENMKKIIKGQVKSQVKEQVSRILPRIEEYVNATLEAEVLTISSHSSRTSYAIAADLSEMELKKILIEKMEGNKSIQRSDEQRNLYKALVEAYEADKAILDTYGESTILKRRREDDDQEGPSAGSDRESKRQKEGGEHASASTPSETATGSAGRSTTGRPPSPNRDWNKTLPVAQGDAQSWISNLARQTDARSSFNELLDTLIDFFNFIMNRLGVATLTPELLAGPTYELMRGSYLEPHAMWIQEPINYDRHALWGVSYWGRKRQQFYGFAVNWESALDVYSKRRIIAVTVLKIMEWHDYKHLDWISVRRDDDKIYKFKEGDFKRLRIQDIEDMLLLLRRVEDLQLGVKSYQKRLNLTKPDTYRIDLRRREAYTAYSIPRGFIYQNNDKKNGLMRIDEFHKFSDGTLNDVRNALDDCLKGIRMQYLPTTIWRKGDKDRAAAMIQAIEKILKTRRIIRSLEKFVGGRL
nr:hypothetical protein [Tanacetum cinerariifolium]